MLNITKFNRAFKIMKTWVWVNFHLYFRIGSCTYILEENKQFNFKIEIKGNKTFIKLVKTNTNIIKVTGLKATVRYHNEIIKHFQYKTFDDVRFQS